MADPTTVWKDNLPGKWYVDKSCILCSVCSTVAPNNFKEAESGDHDIVYKQPSTEDEEKACQDALEQCPVESIGKDL